MGFCDGQYAGGGQSDRGRLRAEAAVAVAAAGPLWRIASGQRKVAKAGQWMHVECDAGLVVQRRVQPDGGLESGCVEYRMELLLSFWSFAEASLSLQSGK